MDADSAGRRGERATRPGPSPVYYVTVGALWGLLTLGAWLWGQDLFLKVGDTVLAVAWLGWALVSLLKRRRAKRDAAKAL